MLYLGFFNPYKNRSILMTTGSLTGGFAPTNTSFFWLLTDLNNVLLKNLRFFRARDLDWVKFTVVTIANWVMALSQMAVRLITWSFVMNMMTTVLVWLFFSKTMPLFACKTEAMSLFIILAFTFNVLTVQFTVDKLYTVQYCINNNHSSLLC